MTDAREPSRGGAHAASPHEASHPDGTSGCGVPRPARRPRPPGGSAGAREETGARGRAGDVKGEWRGVRVRKRKGRTGLGDRNSRLPPKWIRRPPPTLNKVGTTSASPFLGLSGAAPCHVRNAITGLTPRTPSIEPFGHLSTPPATASIGCLGITSALVEAGARATGPALAAVVTATLAAASAGCRIKSAKSSAHTPPRYPLATFRTSRHPGDSRQPSKDAVICVTYSGRVAPPPETPLRGAKVKLRDRAGTPPSDL